MSNCMNQFSLEGKVALVTGGAHSIGFALGVGLAKAGATVCFNCSSEESRQRGLAAYAEAGIDVKGYVCDVTDETPEMTEQTKINISFSIFAIMVPVINSEMEDNASASNYNKGACETVQ